MFSEHLLRFVFAEMSSKAQLVRQKRGNDFCGTTKSYVVRSDLGCFAKLSSNTLHDANPEILKLHSSCTDGDHYMAYECAPEVGSDYEYFYVIKGNTYREVTNLSSDADAKEGDLHKDLQGGDFYLASSKYHHYSVSPVFIVIFEKEGYFRAVSNLSTAEPAEYLEFKDKKRQYPLHSKCKNGLYYWATKSYWRGDVWYYIVTGIDQWGVKVHYTKNLSTNEGGYDETINPSVVNFLPGGLAATIGPTVGYWKLVSSYSNTGTTAMQFSRTMEVNVGYKKSAKEEVQHNWKIGASYSTEFEGLLFGATCKQQFSLSAEYGGSAINTKEETWAEETTTTEKVEKPVPAGESLYIWQFCLGVREGSTKKALCLSQIFDFSKSSSPPTKIPAGFT